MNCGRCLVALLTTGLLVACTSPATPAGVETLPTDTSAPVATATATAEPTSTPEPTDTPTPVPTPTFEARSVQEVRVDCRKDQDAEELLVEVDDGATVHDVAADPFIADCYGETQAERAHTIGAALEAQDGLSKDTGGAWADGEVLTGTYRLYLSVEV